MQVKMLQEPQQTSPGTEGDYAARHLALAATVRAALVEHQLLAEAVEQLGATVGSQVRRLGRQLSSLMEALEQPSGPGSPITLTGAPPRVAVHCLGAFRLLVHGTPVEQWRSGKARALFQYLLMHRDRPVPRETLIQALWPAPDAVAVGTSLKVTVHALRQTLAQVGQTCASPVLMVEAQDCGYRLIAPDLWLDVEEFERCCILARRLERQGYVEDALWFYTRAVELYRGDLLEDSWEEWVIFRREGLKDYYLHALARLADAAFEAGDYQGCIQRCQQMLEKDRCCEDTYRMLMLCHARLGQRGRVRRWYDLCVRTLRAELDVDPEPETVRIYHVALQGDNR
jgi:DNA-binding SARP family transcriptional activator